MIDNKKINSVQRKIQDAIKKIELEENVKIDFGTISYNSARYNTKMTVTTCEKNKKVEVVFTNICKKLGFTQNIIGMTFEGKNGNYEILDIKTNNRKYPIIAKSLLSDKTYKFSVLHIKELIGGDKIINRNANLDKLIQ